MGIDVDVKNAKRNGNATNLGQPLQHPHFIAQQSQTQTDTRRITDSLSELEKIRADIQRLTNERRNINERLFRLRQDRGRLERQVYEGNGTVGRDYIYYVPKHQIVPLLERWRNADEDNSMLRLSDRSGLSTRSLRRIRNDSTQRFVGLNTAERILDAIGLHLDESFEVLDLTQVRQYDKVSP